MSLIQRQEACIARMFEARTSERRAAKNRSAAIRQFRRQCLRTGYTEAETEQLVADVVATYQLQRNAED